MDLESVDASYYDDSSVELINSMSPSQLERMRLSALNETPLTGILSN